MLSSFLLVEFPSIAIGYKEINDIILNYPVYLFLSRNVCPGRIVFILNGNDNDILDIHNYFKTNKILSIDILNVEEEVIAKINKNTKASDISKSSLMMCEFKNSISAIKASDLVFKAANVSLLKISFRVGLFGKSIAIFSGLLSDLESSKTIILDNFTNKDVVALEIIENPVGELLEWI
ncbi:BMC domain-containing protein [Peptoniphilus sp. MSJ-1]|uniref:BMC domain-containing protein n=1 Tax=Peptoniphilus ovalis TaxID=2841503 RepID=A0ABS6FJY9_9FIRM|nr:BMC domain-containing protein [Peptoniphilus ovalis]MBU5669778.1 BMC domain-containing protein [Peptoniphilus ovalis]